ncbi:hypothetical protein KY290_031268 [Solanum tuberosum]|uniref:Integrase core domain containing protein n=1 Tax=Solanum tuberosum TaxID=4113 RepID=A0ABQ7U8P0_SOLTU|nr:hypothetical protein KY290_031268 [Solanum tuberosum]
MEKIIMAWHTRDRVKGGSVINSIMTNEMRNKEEERDEQMAKVMTSIDLLIEKHMMCTRAKIVNSIRAQSTTFFEYEVAYASFDEAVRYLANQGLGSRPGYQATNQGLWHPSKEIQG